MMIMAIEEYTCRQSLKTGSFFSPPFRAVGLWWVGTKSNMHFFLAIGSRTLARFSWWNEHTPKLKDLLELMLIDTTLFCGNSCNQAWETNLREICQKLCTNDSGSYELRPTHHLSLGNYFRCHPGINWARCGSLKCFLSHTHTYFWGFSPKKTIRTTIWGEHGQFSH